MEYHQIENYGIIGNMLTTALIGKDGAIDWMCQVPLTYVLSGWLRH